MLAFRDLRSFNEARRQAVTDDLTDLPNRRLFQRRLAEAIERGESSGESIAVMIVDLNHFKELNDTLGHHSGDVLLRQIGPRLATVLRPIDTLARLGGDEFGIVLDAPSDGKFALAVADRLRAALARPFDVQDIALSVDASVGIALFPAHAETAEELLQHADVAMYQAKKAQSGRDSMHASATRIPASGLPSPRSSRTRSSTTRSRRTSSRRPTLADRPDHRRGSTRSLAASKHGLLPEVFIPLAEHRADPHLTRSVRGLALAQCAAWRAAGLDLHVSVNFAVADLLDVDLPASDDARAHGLPASALIVEVTESSVLSAIPSASATSSSPSTGSGSACRSTTSARASRPSTTSRASRWARSRSTARSSRRWHRPPPTPPS